jgi:hypothetical protein
MISEVVYLLKCATAIKCMLFLHTIQHVCSLDCNTARFLSGTGIFHSETQYKTAVPEQCSGENPSIALETCLRSLRCCSVCPGRSEQVTGHGLQ